MYLYLIITIDRARSTLLIEIDSVNTACACVYLSANFVNCRMSLLFYWDIRQFSRFVEPRSHTTMAHYIC